MPVMPVILEQLNLYSHQNGRNFTVTKEELKAFIEINFVMAINKLSTIAEDWRVYNLIGNVVLRTQLFETVSVRSFKMYILQITERMIKQARLSR